MTLAFEFKMAHKSHEFIFLLSKFCQNLKHKLQIDGDFITLFLSGSEEKLYELSNALSNNLPHSIFLQDSRVYLGDDFDNCSDENVKNIATYKITPSVVNAYKKAKFIKNEFGLFSAISVFGEQLNEYNLSNILKKAVDEFLSNQNIELKDQNGSFYISLSRGNPNYIMPTNLKNIPKMFIANEASLVALASFEKPILKLKTTAVFRQNHKDAFKFYNVKAADDIFLYAFCDELFKKGINFISIRHQNLKQEPLLMLDDGMLFSVCDKNNISKPALNLDFNTKTADSISFKGVDLLFLPKFKSFGEIINLIKQLPNGDVFIQNFGSKFKIPQKDIDLKPSLFSLLCIVGVAIGLDSDFKKAGEMLLLNASDFSVKKGVSIECGRDKNEFNSIKFIKSAMSFYLAGAGAHNISFGCIQSLAIFFSDFCYEYANELGFGDIVFSGDMFKNEIFSNLFYKHINPNLDITFRDFIKI